jgi:hypothetical protein
LLVRKKNCHSSYLCLVWWKCSTPYFAEVACSTNITVVGASFTVPPDPKEGNIIAYQCVTGFESSSGSIFIILSISMNCDNSFFLPTIWHCFIQNACYITSKAEATYEVY